MRHLSRVVVMVGLLAQAGSAHAIIFQPERSMVPAAEGTQPTGLTVGLYASSWGLPDQAMGTTGTIEYTAQARPLVTAEYRLNERWSAGGWYNFIAWDGKFKALDPAWAPVSAEAKSDGGILEVHGTYSLPSESALGLSAQFGYQRTEYDGTATFSGTTTAGTVVAGTQPFSKKRQHLVAWGLGSYKLTSEGKVPGLSALGGLGLAQGLDKQSGALQLHALVGASVAFTPALSADASVWLYDFARDNSKARFTAGVTGRF